MICSRKELKFYLQADLMMNRGYFKRSVLRRIYELWMPDEVMSFLRAMRKYSYYTPPNCKSLLNKVAFFILSQYYKRKFILEGNKLGLSIGKDCFGYGLVIHHPGTIVVGSNNRIGNYALLNTSTCIIQNGSRIGDGLFMGTGATIIKNVSLAENVWVGANSVVNKSFGANMLIGGAPAKEIKSIRGGWYQYLYKDEWYRRYTMCEKLKKEMGLN